MVTKFKSIQPLIPAINVDQAAAFYQTNLGFKLAWCDGVPATLAIVCRGEVEIFLSQDENGEHALAASMRIAVDNIDELYAEYKPKSVIHPNGDLTIKPWGLKEFIIQDLNGVCIAFHEMPKPPCQKILTPNVELETEKLRLLPLRREHFQELHTIYSNPSTMKNWHTLTHTKFSETEKILNEYMDTNSSWVLELKENKKVIGLINCFTVESNKSTGMGYIISSDYQKRGLAYEASQIIIQHLFKKWNLPFIELWIYEDNLPSIGLAQKLGFTLENSFERLGADGISMKKTGIYWLRQCDWWMNKLKG